MKMEVQTQNKKFRFSFSAFLLFVMVSVFSAGITGCEDTTDTSLDDGCQVDSDCPLPDRQKCNTELGVCVGHTTTPGDVDAAPGDDADF
ncbi:MAG: hypothetical protein JXR95_03300 [Deltaproteobacteria bacterium]|nr:hypothetical protein [Deltaproteobacteria bacterium]